MATDNKYDRQLRLWGPSGQKALMEADILLVNAGATGTETLKNLVLPGMYPAAVLFVPPRFCVCVGRDLSWVIVYSVTHMNILINVLCDVIGSPCVAAKLGLTTKPAINIWCFYLVRSTRYLCPLMWEAAESVLRLVKIPVVINYFEVLVTARSLGLQGYRGSPAKCERSHYHRRAIALP